VGTGAADRHGHRHQSSGRDPDDQPASGNGSGKTWRIRDPARPGTCAPTVPMLSAFSPDGVLRRVEDNGINRAVALEIALVVAAHVEVPDGTSAPGTYSAGVMHEQRGTHSP
jgi:hypothetical protein